MGLSGRRKDKSYAKNIMTKAEVENMARLQYQKLKERAAPCILQNLVTEQSKYVFVMEGPNGNNRTEMAMRRNPMDTAKSQELTAICAIDAMRTVIMNDLPLSPEEVYDYCKDAYPYRLDILQTASAGAYNVKVRTEDHRITKNMDVVLSADIAGAARVLAKEIQVAEKTRAESAADKPKEFTGVAQLVKKPLVCPEHGNLMVPTDTVGELHCPIFGCKTVARKKTGPDFGIGPTVSVDRKGPHPITSLVIDGKEMIQPPKKRTHSQNRAVGLSVNDDPPRFYEHNGRLYLLQKDVLFDTDVWIDVTTVCTKWEMYTDQIQMGDGTSTPGLKDLRVELHPRLEQ